MFISASIVLYETPKFLIDRIINCVSSATIIDYLIIVDNSIGDPKYDLDGHKFIKYVKSKSNLGYGSAHNVAIREILSISDYHFVLNPDIIFTSESINLMIDRMESDLDIGQLMPTILNPDGTIQYVCKILPTPFDLIFRRFLKFAQDNNIYELRFTEYKYEMNVPYLSGCFMLFRVSALREIGIFDERFFMYPEDVDITRRMHEKFITLFFPGASVIHDHAKASYKNFKMLWIHAVNMIRYFNKWGWIYDPIRVRVNKETLSSLTQCPQKS